MGRQAKYATEEERQAAIKKYQQVYRANRRQARREGILLVSTRRGAKPMLEKEAAITLFKRAGCVACGETFAGCLDAHHLRDKEYPLGDLMRLGDLQMFQQELAKCVPLCANCHRKHHAGLQVINPDGTKYLGEADKKRCNSCHLELPLTNFELRCDPTKPVGTRRGTCRMCRNRT